MYAALLAILGLGPAQGAVDPVVEVGEPVSVDLSGVFVRVLPRGEGEWAVVSANQDGMYVTPLVHDGSINGWTASSGEWQALTQREGLKDHAITRCDDGSYLHVASANIDTPNDSAYGFRTSSDWAPLADGVIAERDGDWAHNDPPVVCSGPFQGTAFAWMDAGPRNVFVYVDDDGAAAGEVPLAEDPRTNGSAFLAEGGLLHHVGYGHPTNDASLNTYNEDLELVEERVIALVEAPLLGTWPQGFIRVGALYVVAMLARDPADDVQGVAGDAWLIFLDSDFQVVARHALTDFGPDAPPERPGVAFQDDLLVVSFDRESRQYVQAVRVDLDLIGEATVDDDTGRDTGDSGDGGDGGDAGGVDPDEKGCGCQAAGTAPALGWVWVLAVWARRRSPAGDGAGEVSD
jgi:hypothetical protein